MKRAGLLSLLLIVLAGTGFQCRREKPQGPMLEGKLVVTGPCAHWIVQVIGGHIDPSRVLATWRDSVADTTYTNVFTVANFCQFGSNGLRKNDIFYFRINDTVMVNNCAICEIYYPTPGVFNTVSHVRRVQ